MTKEDILTILKEAKVAHVRMHKCAEALAVGSESCNKDIPISHHDCEFGKWYYSTGLLLKFSENFAPIEAVHEKMHLIYKVIYKKAMPLIKRGIIHREGFSNTRKGKEIDKLYDHFRQTSKLFMSAVTDLENEISAMSSIQIGAKMLEKKYIYIV